jgi:hypothetical protein
MMGKGNNKQKNNERGKSWLRQDVIYANHGETFPKMMRAFFR